MTRLNKSVRIFMYNFEIPLFAAITYTGFISVSQLQQLPGITIIFDRDEKKGNDLFIYDVINSTKKYDFNKRTT